MSDIDQYGKSEVALATVDVIQTAALTTDNNTTPNNTDKPKLTLDQSLFDQKINVTVVPPSPVDGAAKELQASITDLVLAATSATGKYEHTTNPRIAAEITPNQNRDTPKLDHKATPTKSSEETATGNNSGNISKSSLTDDKQQSRPQSKSKLLKSTKSLASSSDHLNYDAFPLPRIKSSSKFANNAGGGSSVKVLNSNISSTGLLDDSGGDLASQKTAAKASQSTIHLDEFSVGTSKEHKAVHIIGDKVKGKVSQGLFSQGKNIYMTDPRLVEEFCDIVKCELKEAEKEKLFRTHQFRYDLVRNCAISLLVGLNVLLLSLSSSALGLIYGLAIAGMCFVYCGLGMYLFYRQRQNYTWLERYNTITLVCLTLLLAYLFILSYGLPVYTLAITTNGAILRIQLLSGVIGFLAFVVIMSFSAKQRVVTPLFVMAVAANIAFAFVSSPLYSTAVVAPYIIMHAVKSLKFVVMAGKLKFKTQLNERILFFVQLSAMEVVVSWREKLLPNELFVKFHDTFMYSTYLKTTLTMMSIDMGIAALGCVLSIGDVFFWPTLVRLLALLVLTCTFGAVMYGVSINSNLKERLNHSLLCIGFMLLNTVIFAVDAHFQVALVSADTWAVATAKSTTFTLSIFSNIVGMSASGIRLPYTIIFAALSTVIMWSTTYAYISENQMKAEAQSVIYNSLIYTTVGIALVVGESLKLSSLFVRAYRQFIRK